MLVSAKNSPSATPTGHAKSDRIPTLDGLRALSIGIVLIAHLGKTRGFPSNAVTRVICDHPGFGVRAFFVISGYLITRLLLDELERTGTVSFAKFYLRRTLRIFPAFYALILAVLVGQWLGWLALEPGDALSAFTYTMNYHQSRAWWLGHVWSLSVEEQFYLLWPFLLAVLRPRRADLALFGIILVAPLVRIGTFYLLPEQRLGIGETFLTVADSLAVGCLLSLKRAELDTSRVYQRLLRSPAFAFLPILAMLCSHYTRHARFSFLIGETVTNLAIGLCVDRCVRMPQDTIGRILQRPAIVYVGTLSYSLYLWQQVFMRRDSAALIHTYPINLVLALGAAILSHQLVEKPFLRLRLRIEQRARRPADPIELNAPSPRPLSASVSGRRSGRHSLSVPAAP